MLTICLKFNNIFLFSWEFCVVTCPLTFQKPGNLNSNWPTAMLCWQFFLKPVYCNERNFYLNDFYFSQHDVTPITMALNGAARFPQACQALTSMLSRNALNPADITVLYRNYSAVDPPPIDLVRTPQFLGKYSCFLWLRRTGERL